MGTRIAREEIGALEAAALSQDRKRAEVEDYSPFLARPRQLPSAAVSSAPSSTTTHDT